MNDADYKALEARIGEIDDRMERMAAAIGLTGSAIKDVVAACVLMQADIVDIQKRMGA